MNKIQTFDQTKGAILCLLPVQMGQKSKNLLLALEESNEQHLHCINKNLKRSRKRCFKVQNLDVMSNGGHLTETGHLQGATSMGCCLRMAPPVDLRRGPPPLAQTFLTTCFQQSTIIVGYPSSSTFSLFFSIYNLATGSYEGQSTTIKAVVPEVVRSYLSIHLAQMI